MPNLLYVALQVYGKVLPEERRMAPWQLFRLLAEIHREIEREALNRFFAIDPPIPLRTVKELLSAAAQG